MDERKSNVIIMISLEILDVIFHIIGYKNQDVFSEVLG